MQEKLTLKDIVFFTIIIVMAVGCIIAKVHGDKQIVEASKEQEKVVVGVHIKGEVNNPGYYEFDYGQRIKDAIKKAGGETENADINSVNLAEKLRDGTEITIPSKNVQEDKEKVSDGKININTASLYEFLSLDGIGESIAKDIIAYRESKGKFTKTTDLKKISGIGASKFNKIKDKIKVTD